MIWLLRLAQVGEFGAYSKFEVTYPDTVRFFDVLGIPASRIRRNTVVCVTIESEGLDTGDLQYENRGSEGDASSDSGAGRNLSLWPSDHPQPDTEV